MLAPASKVIDDKDYKGAIILHYAMRGAHKVATRLLLELSVDLTITS